MTDPTEEPTAPGRFDPEIAAYYAAGGEAGRLLGGGGRLERARTEELLRRYLPPPPATVLDVGGASGVYARWLAGRGYTVHLIDASPLHVHQAATTAPGPGEGAIAGVHLGDARRLPQQEASADAVLLLGPLYHLTTEADRHLAWREAARVLRPGGIAAGAGISRFASFLDWLNRQALFTPELAAIATEDLQTGQHRNTTGDPQYFTTAYFHRPEDLRADPAAAGLEPLDLLAVEGPGAFVGRVDDWWDDPQRRERVFALLRLVEREPALLGVSPHLLVVARKP